MQNKQTDCNLTHLLGNQGCTYAYNTPCSCSCISSSKHLRNKTDKRLFQILQFNKFPRDFILIIIYFCTVNRCILFRKKKVKLTIVEIEALILFFIATYFFDNMFYQI